MSEFESNEPVASRVLRGDMLSAIEGWLALDMDGFATLCRLREAVGMRPPEMYVLVERWWNKHNTGTPLFSLVGERTTLEAKSGFLHEQHVYVESTQGESTCKLDLFFKQTAASFGCSNLVLSSCTVSTTNKPTKEADQCRGAAFHSSQEVVKLVLKGKLFDFMPFFLSRPVVEGSHRHLDLNKNQIIAHLADLRRGE